MSRRSARIAATLPLVLTLAACGGDASDAVTPPQRGPVASYDIYPPSPGITFTPGSTLHLDAVIYNAEDAAGRGIPVDELHPHWAVAHESGGARLAEGDGLLVTVPEPNADGQAYVMLWVVDPTASDGPPERTFAISVAQ